MSYAPAEPGEKAEHQDAVSDDELFADSIDEIQEKKDVENNADKNENLIVPGAVEQWACEPCEARAPKHLNEPIKPSAEDHYLTHLPYRNWCPICVKARGREDPHWRKSSKKREETAEDAIPELALHYNELDADDGEKLKTIVGKDKPSGRVLQHQMN